MRKIFQFTLVAAFGFLLYSCDSSSSSGEPQTVSTPEASASIGGGQSTVKDDDSQKDVVKVAVGSKDHTTLVAAVKQAGLVDVLSNAGPFTVFAPTNAAFDKVPKETLAALMKDDKKEQLKDILQYHVYVGGLKAENFTDGQVLNEVNGQNITVSVKDGKVVLNGTATIIASIPAANGIVHVIDGVLLPPAK